MRRLLSLGLLVRRDDETVELPRQVGLAMRGDRPMGPLRPTPPRPAAVAHGVTKVDGAGAGEAVEIVRHMTALLDLWSAEPPPVLRSGGLGVREQRRLAKQLDVTEQRAVLLAELAAGADLVADTEHTAPEWVPTTQADTWQAASTEQRWAGLAYSWLTLPRLPGLAGLRDDKDRLLVPLSDELRRPLAPRDRRWILRALAELEPGAGIARPEDLMAVLSWRAPRRGGRMRDDLVRWTLAEAATLGVVALGGLTSAGRALLSDGATAAAKQLAAALPEPIDHVLAQADLTVVAPGPLEPMLAEEMALVADVESAGSATVYRVTEASVRRALDAGRTATELHELFRTRSRTPVPQALDYLIDDVARRHGRLRGGAAASFLRCDDEALLVEVLANPVAAELRPAADRADGRGQPGPAARGAGRPARGRVRPRGRGPGRPGRRHPPGRAAAAGEGTRAPAQPGRAGGADAGPGVPDRLQPARGRRGIGPPPGIGGASSVGGGADTSATLELLSRATLERREVWIGFVDSRGTASQRVVRPIRVGGGVLEGDNNERYSLTASLRRRWSKTRAPAGRPGRAP